jgi:hypothetical protein
MGKYANQNIVAYPAQGFNHIIPLVLKIEEKIPPMGACIVLCESCEFQANSPQIRFFRAPQAP